MRRARSKLIKQFLKARRTESDAKDFIIYNDDCIERMKLLKENSIDAIVTDPPYGIAFMNKHWDKMDSRGFQKFSQQWAEQALRILKPGGHLLAFSGTRTYHRMVCGVENAGFEIRDQIAWVNGSGFPKSANISKHIDRIKGVKRKIVASVRVKGGGTEHLNRSNHNKHAYRPGDYQKGENVLDITESATREAKKWEGWGTSLKPAWEPIVVARKPFKGSVAQNILKYGAGAINIDASRIATDSRPLLVLDAKQSAKGSVFADRRKNENSGFEGGSKAVGQTNLGRWPANFIHDGSEQVLALFPDSKSCDSPSSAKSKGNILVKGHKVRFTLYQTKQREQKYKNKGAVGFRMKEGLRRASVRADRFFYCSKVSKKERTVNGRVENNHPTVKPIDLMRYLIVLVTPPGGTVLDPFSGSGSTAIAAIQNGFHYIGIEQDPDYVRMSKERIKYSLAKIPKRK